MDTLARKLRRDLHDIRGQAITIALVVASGVASYISLRSTFSSIHESRDRYYATQRFGDGFAQLRRAPERLAKQIEAIPGVLRVETRVTGAIRIHLPAPAKVATGLVVSVPGAHPPSLNRYHLVSGRPPAEGRTDEALLLEAFGDRHGIAPGDVLSVTLSGSERRIRVVGLATSPEFVYPMGPGSGAIPDDERFGVLWMDRNGIDSAYEMLGAFNDVVVATHPNASERAILADLDRLLSPYGGVGAYGRDLQPSNMVLEGELEQLRAFATVLPLVFLGVAAFLLNVVLFRLIQLHRGQIATLKAVGYDDRRIGSHYLTLTVLIVFLGVGLGTALGVWLGRELTELYSEFFRIPVLTYRLQPSVFASAAGVSILAGLAGALRGVLKVARMPPAEAMRPPAPTTYRRTVLERTGITRLFGTTGRMVIREIERAPLRTAASALGIAFAMAIMITGRFGYDMIEVFVDLQFSRIMREDMTVVFTEARSESAIRELAHLPGVTRAEGLRAVPTRFRVGNRWRDAVIYGYPEGTELRQLRDKLGNLHIVPSRGVALTSILGEILDVEPGDVVQAEIQEGRRPTLSLVVASLVEEPVGLQGHMDLEELAALLREAPAFSFGLLAAGTDAEAGIRSGTDDLPGVLDVISTRDMVARFHEQTGDYFWVMTLMLSLFSAAIAVGVIYNNARVMLSVRQRDLSSLRVLGFTKREIAAIMAGELGAQVLLAIPLGAALGNWGAQGVMATVSPERFRFPTVVGADTYLFAVLVLVASALIAGLLVRRRVYHLDLIAVLKTRE